MLMIHEFIINSLLTYVKSLEIRYYIFWENRRFKNIVDDAYKDKRINDKYFRLGKK